MNSIFITSTSKIISASRASTIEDVYFDNSRLPKGRTIILQHLAPKTFWINNVVLENGAEAELLDWLRKQKKLEVFCIQKMPCRCLRNAAKTLFYSKFTLNVADFYIEEQQLSAQCLAILSEYLEHKQTIQEITLNDVRLTCGELKLSIVMMQVFRLQKVFLTGIFFLAPVAFSLAYALKNAGNQFKPDSFILMDLHCLIVFKLFLSIIQKQAKESRLTVKPEHSRPKNTQEAQFLQDILGSRLDMNHE